MGRDGHPGEKTPDLGHVDKKAEERPGPGNVGKRVPPDRNTAATSGSQDIRIRYPPLPGKGVEDVFQHGKKADAYPKRRTEKKEEFDSFREEDGHLQGKETAHGMPDEDKAIVPFEKGFHHGLDLFPPKGIGATPEVPAVFPMALQDKEKGLLSKRKGGLQKVEHVWVPGDAVNEKEGPFLHFPEASILVLERLSFCHLGLVTMPLMMAMALTIMKDGKKKMESQRTFLLVTTSLFLSAR